MSIFYKINDSVVFHPDEKKVSLDSDIETYVNLTKPACRLLLEFVNNPDSIMTRDYLIDKVWGVYGFSGSSSNLNKIISEIRKSLDVFFPGNEMVQTHPKLGITFHSHIETINKNNHCLADMSSLYDEKKVSINEKIRKKTILTYAVFFVLAIFCMFYFLKNSWVNSTIIDKIHLFDINECQIFSFKKPSELTIDELKESIKNDIVAENINCHANKKTIFYSNEINSNIMPILKSIIVCSNSLGGEYDNCLTIHNYYGAKP